MNYTSKALCVVAAGCMVAQAQQSQPAGQSQSQTQPPSTREQQNDPHMHDKSMMKIEAAMTDAGQFLRHCARGNKKEIAQAEMATRQATRPEVKSLAGRLVADHQALLAEVKAMAQRKGVTLTDGTGKEDTDRTRTEGEMKAQMEAQMEAMTGAGFDRMFLDHQAKHHAKNIQTFENASKNHSDSDIRTLTAKYLPTLRQHHELIQSLQKSGMNSGRTGTPEKQ